MSLGITIAVPVGTSYTTPPFFRQHNRVNIYGLNPFRKFLKSDYAIESQTVI